MNEPIKKQAGSVVRLTRALRAPQGKPGKKELEANFPRLSEKHWHVDDWTHVDGARLQPEPVALIARRRSHRRLLAPPPAEARPNEALKRGVEDACLAQLEQRGLITTHR